MYRKSIGLAVTVRSRYLTLRERRLGVLLQNRAPTKVLVLIDIARREAPVENSYRVESSALWTLLVAPPLIAIEVVTVAAVAPVSVGAVTALSMTVLSTIFVPVSMLHAAANSDECAEQRK